MTREERRVLLFLVLGALFGFVVGEWGRNEPPAPVVVEESEDVIVVDLYPIDLNRASPELLEELPGIGPSKAAAIVAHRDAHGPFPTVDALTDVPGFGPRTVERLRERITVSSDLGARQESDLIVELTPRNAPSGEPVALEGATGSGQEPAEVVR